MSLKIEKLNNANIDDFFFVHSVSNDHAWCFCVAWHVSTWDGWGERTAELNIMKRKHIHESGNFDGYIFYIDESPAGWAQVTKRDIFQKLCKQYKLVPDPSIWAITCLFLGPEFRKRGLTHSFLDLILEDLGKAGIKKVQAFPKCGLNKSDGEVWTGPESVYKKAGFNIESGSDKFPVYSIYLSETSLA